MGGTPGRYQDDNNSKALTVNGGNSNVGGNKNDNGVVGIEASLRSHGMDAVSVFRRMWRTLRRRSKKTFGSAENILMAFMPSVYVDGLSLGLILSLSIIPSLSPNAGHVERISVKNAGLEPSFFCHCHHPCQRRHSRLPPPPPLRATLRIDHASLSSVVSVRA